MLEIPPIIDIISQFVQSQTTVLNVALSSVPVWGILLYRLRTIETKRERETYLQNKYKGQIWEASPDYEGVWEKGIITAEVVDMTVNEETGWRYKLRKIVYDEIEAQVVVSVKVNFRMPNEYWTSDLFEDLYSAATEGTVKLVEHRSSTLFGESVWLLVDSVEVGEIDIYVKRFLFSIIQVDMMTREQDFHVDPDSFFITR